MSAVPLIHMTLSLVLVIGVIISVVYRVDTPLFRAILFVSTITCDIVGLVAYGSVDLFIFTNALTISRSILNLLILGTLVAAFVGLFLLAVPEYCKKCKLKLGDNVTFCPHCGTKVNET